MSFSDRVTMAFLEEDNAQRAFFRLRPLLNSNGPCTAEELATIPDEGYLRIVPDKNEQSNFKDRMRALGHLCCIDLSPYPSEANKIRTNKNYSVEKGEKNQYILYSDVIHPLPANLVYEVQEISSPEKAEKCSFITPLGYARIQDKWIGPFSTLHPAVEEVKDAFPDEQIFTIFLPDGKQHTFCWAKSEAAFASYEASPSIDEEAEEEKLSVPSLHLVQRHSLYDEEIIPELSISRAASSEAIHTAYAMPSANSMRLSGTPLYVAPPLKDKGIRTRNPLHEVVDAQWRAAKYEAPSAQLQQGANLRHVENPLERCREALEAVWGIPEAQAKVLEMAMALPGMQQRMERYFHSEEPDSILLTSMRKQLQDMEAERLSLLIQLDKAKENKAAYREEVTSGIQHELSAKTAQFHQEIANYETAVHQLKEQLEVLTAQKNMLEKTRDDLLYGELPNKVEGFSKAYQVSLGYASRPLQLSAVVGADTPAAQMILSLQRMFSREWPALGHEDAVHILLLMALCPQIQISHSSLSEAARFARNCAEALGLTSSFAVQAYASQSVLANPLPHASSPIILATPYLFQGIPSFGQRILLLAKSPALYTDQACYDLSPWPVFTLPVTHAESPSVSATAVPPLPSISFASLVGLLQEERLPEQDTSGWFHSLKEAALASGVTLPQDVLRAMTTYMCIAGKMMHGGIAAAADYALLSWIAPTTLKNPKFRNSLKPLLSALPRSSEMLK